MHWYCRSDQHSKCTGRDLLHTLSGVKVGKCGCRCHNEKKES